MLLASTVKSSSWKMPSRRTSNTPFMPGVLSAISRKRSRSRAARLCASGRSSLITHSSPSGLSVVTTLQRNACPTVAAPSDRVSSMRWMRPLERSTMSSREARTISGEMGGRLLLRSVTASRRSSGSAVCGRPCMSFCSTGPAPLIIAPRISPRLDWSPAKRSSEDAMRCRSIGSILEK